MHIIDNIVFIYSDQPIIERGWNTKYVKTHLRYLGIPFREVYVADYVDFLDSLNSFDKHSLVWPVCYTLGRELSNDLLVDKLSELDIRYVGSSGRCLRLNSKLHLKKLLKGSKFKTPDYKEVRSSKELEFAKFAMPMLIKSEFSCNSEGVELVENVKELEKKFDFLSKKYQQNIFTEKWEKKREFTVAYIQNGSDSIIAPAEIVLTNNSPIIDRNEKKTNKNLKFLLPESSLTERLKEFTKSFVKCFSLDGLFRVDILMNESNEFHVIDMNFLPHLNSNEDSYSYLPKCLELNFNFDFKDVLISILKSTCKNQRFVFNPEIESRLMLFAINNAE